MISIKELLQQVFPNPENITSGKEPILRENISRNERFLEGFVSWRDSEPARSLFQMFRETMHNGGNRKDEHIDAGYYTDRGIEGLLIRSFTGGDKLHFQYLIEFVRERILQLNYRLYHGIEEHREQNGKIRSVEEYYLKPSVRSRLYPLKQEFGNLTLELNLVNDEVQFLKVIASTYSGYNYEEPKPFPELILSVFTVE
jgi:hypothetical protein